MHKFLKFFFYAVRRYGQKAWQPVTGYMQFNTAYVVSVSSCEVPELHQAGQGHDYPFIVELSNGTRFLTYFHEYGEFPEDTLLDETCQEYNGVCANDPDIEKLVNKYLYKL